MFNFTFHNFTKVHFGEGQISQIQHDIPQSAKVLLVYGGGSIKNNGIYQQVTQALSAHQVVEFSGIEANPQYDTLMQGVALAKAQQVDYILAVGGGSVIDGCKFISAALKFDGQDPWDLMIQKAAVTAVVPMGVVLTLAATGSETNPATVVSRGEDKFGLFNPILRPQFAVLDPSVTLSLTDRQISNGVVDAFVHVIEQYLTYPVNAKVQDRFAEGLLLTLIEEGQKVISAEHKNDLEVRANLMFSATMALNGLIGTGVPHDWSTHMIGHELTAAYGIDHARSLSILLPSMLRERQQVKQAKLLQFAERVWNITDGTDDQKIAAAITKMEQFFKQLGAPICLSDANLDESHIPDIIQRLKGHGMTALGEDQMVTLDVVERILNRAL
ncbi:iron-containing alcohol dehydrogenase [Paraferrimonas sp. SM1919]|uniref:iron-containing alcohol dehydrogenase n=1 Tax=Paraferrimonas sp. SM1919 TaxID=2662263 RepID=UPI0013D63215|nr:iron-containing alcohol dehydrogenase [Paraferrimonas sp. SM1919]